MPYWNQNPNVGWGWGRGLFALLLMLVALAIIVWVVTALVRPGGHLHHHGFSSDTNPSWTQSSGALRILDERLARGDIDTDEYTKRRELLQGSAQRTP